MPPKTYSVTPLGYLVLLLLSLLVIWQGSRLLAPDPKALIPASWTAKKPAPLPPTTGNSWTDAADLAIAEDTIEDMLDIQNVLPLLPHIYASQFPNLKLPLPLRRSSHHLILAQRLHSFLTRPILSHEQAVKANEEGCPRKTADGLVNPEQFEGGKGFWEGVGEGEIVRRRADVVKYISERLEGGQEVIGRRGKLGHGRGIVLTGGNKDTTLRTITTIKHLRGLGVDLPIEVFHYPGEISNRKQRQAIEELGATLREAKGLSKEPGAWKNWQIKGAALVDSSFREIIYLDSDNTPLRSPVHLFDAPIYTTSGRAAFWPDLTKDHPHNAIWRIIGDTCSQDLFTFESGQIVIDKAGNEGLNMAALVIAAGMMRDREFWFRMCGGDKDTFRWAFRVLGLEFGVAPRWMGAVGIENGFEGGRFCGHSVLQHDLIIPEGFTKEPPLFVHSNLLKHMRKIGLRQGDIFTHTLRMKNDNVSSPSLNYAHSHVYMGQARGMCIDTQWQPNAPESLLEGAGGKEGIEMGRVEETGEGVFWEGFEGRWWEEGGKVGGW
ncbi:hypothetical protein B9479_006234 [Cryptococcus floricola]|uniref:Mannosyltransferase n=1 Tax=Cryptococcus floricola TaxID=2591691 RepID=A0A5D3AQR8_9TREE|nr:hypothetical protein B9479_006234 [Cryptococcus floricola]